MYKFCSLDDGGGVSHVVYGSLCLSTKLCTRNRKFVASNSLRFVHFSSESGALLTHPDRDGRHQLGARLVHHRLVHLPLEDGRLVVHVLHDDAHGRDGAAAADVLGVHRQVEARPRHLPVHGRREANHAVGQNFKAVEVNGDRYIVSRLSKHHCHRMNIVHECSVGTFLRMVLPGRTRFCPGLPHQHRQPAQKHQELTLDTDVTSPFVSIPHIPNDTYPHSVERRTRIDTDPDSSDRRPCSHPLRDAELVNGLGESRRVVVHVLHVDRHGRGARALLRCQVLPSSNLP